MAQIFLPKNNQYKINQNVKNVSLKESMIISII